ncbi:MAG: PIN domain-containing protein [Bryobacteraceae bacterium]|jgi:predicted nucleic acid-binding protein
MEPAVLGVVLDSSAVITAERKSLSVPQLVEAIQTSYGEIELSLSPVTVAELVHGIYRARMPKVSQRRREYIEELVNLVPLHPVTLQTGYLVGQIEGQEAKGNVLPFNDLLIAAAAIEQGYAVLTENLRHFEKVPGVRVLRL